MSSYPFVSLNLDILEESKFPSLLSDVGFLYGYGLFETILVKNGQPVLLEKHTRRMQRGSIILDIPLPYTFQDVEAHIHQLIKKNNVSDAILNIYFTYGDRIGHFSSLTMSKSRYICVLRQLNEAAYAKPFELVIREESVQRIKMDRIKTLANMKNVLEKKLCKGFDDVILYNSKKKVLETPSANIFFVKGNCLFSPKSSYIVPGTVSNYIIENAESWGFDCLCQDVLLSDVPQFDEVFLTNAIGGVILVQSIDEFPTLGSRTVSVKIKQAYEASILKGV